ncbi:MAG TPA: rhodanese-like domain-containing protein [Microscillaceae bacterium]|nr:rhodanese-like domain-containing protein [Microscillaceae bacterium]
MGLVVLFNNSLYAQNNIFHKSIDAATFEQELKKNIHTGRIILDVRTTREVARGKIPGAIVIDYYKRGFKQKLAQLDKNRPVFIYCAAGVRSLWAMRKMKRMGFKQVFNLKYGFEDWRRKNYPFAKPK